MGIIEAAQSCPTMGASAGQPQADEAAEWLELSKSRGEAFDFDGAVQAARRAFELAPDSADTLRHLAFALFQTGDQGAIEAKPLFESLLAKEPTDHVALHYLYCYCLFDGDYLQAAKWAEQLNSIFSGDPSTVARIGRAYKLAGDSVSATRHFQLAAEMCDEERLPFPYGASSGLKPVFTALAEDSKTSAHLSRQLCQEDECGLVGLSAAGYSAEAEESIARLQEHVGGRDLYIFGHGPSLTDAVHNKEKLADLDFAAMTMNSFHVVQDDILQPIGRQLDFVCITHPKVLKRQSTLIEKWLASEPSSMLALSLWLRGYLKAAGEPVVLLNHPERVFWFGSSAEWLPPTPTTPLNYPSINTLICALGVAAVARPRRIFLFGFDGKIKGPDSRRAGSLYYREQDKDYLASASADVRRQTQAWLWWDSLRFNENALAVLQHISLMFELPRPPVYNVCPDSAIDIFPRISFDRFCEIVDGL